MPKKGFTLVELLVVISIISLLSSVVLGSLNTARVKSRDTLRIENLHSIVVALNLYYNDNRMYPKTFEPGNPIVVYGECGNNPSTYVPGLAPTYIGKLPSDPALDCGGIPHSWFYASNGKDYKIITHIENQNDPSMRAFADPAYDGGPDYCIIDDYIIEHVGSFSPGAACWSI